MCDAILRVLLKRGQEGHESLRKSVLRVLDGGLLGGRAEVRYFCDQPIHCCV